MEKEKKNKISEPVSHMTEQNIEQEVANMPGVTWAEKLQLAFEDADTNSVGALTLDQWMGSRFPALLSSNSRMTKEQFEEYFHQIDYNCDLSIEWTELVDYLMCHQGDLSSSNREKKLRITYYMPDINLIQRAPRTTKCLKIIYLRTQSIIVTLTETTFTFWKPDECAVIFSVVDKDGFIDCCQLPSLSKVAIIKQNRQIIFYDIRTHQKMNFTVSATLNNEDIPSMSKSEAKKSMIRSGIRKIPLFNVPTAIVGHPDKHILFVGDEEGVIDVYRFFTSRDAKHDWTYSRIKSQPMHTDRVTQLTYFSQTETFASSSSDGTIVLWRYDTKEIRFSKMCSMHQLMNLSIRSFVYDARTRDIVYTTNAHYFGIWRTYTEHQEIIETPSHFIATIQIIPLESDSSFLATFSTDNFISVYQMPNLDNCRTWYMGLQHELCPPTGAIYIDGVLYLVGSFLSAWLCENGENDGLMAHQHPIVCAIANDLFGRVLTFDKSGEAISWDTSNGNKAFSFSVNEDKKTVLCATLDPAERKVAIGFSSGLVKFVSANSGSLLSTIDPLYIPGGCYNIKFTRVNNSQRLVCSSGNRSIVLFEELSGNRTRFVRNFLGHTEHVSKVIILKNEIMLTIGSDHEMFLWNLQLHHPILKFQLPNDPSIATDLTGTPDQFLVGDVVGFIHIMSINEKTPLKSFNGFGMTMKSPITTLLMASSSPLIIASNLHGYVKFWILGQNGNLQDVRRYRGHTEGIVSVTLSEEHRAIATVGRDEEIKLWSIEPFALIGAFGKAGKWDIKNHNTWESQDPLPDDPIHFAEPPDLAQIQLEKEAQENAEKARLAQEEADKQVKILIEEDHSLDLTRLDEMAEKMEHLCETGQKYELMYKAMPKNGAQSARVHRPRRPNIMDKDLANLPEMFKTINKLDEICSRPTPKVIKPLTTHTKNRK